MIICSICNREFKNEKAQRSHSWRSHNEKGKVHGLKTGGHNKGKPSPRKGLTKENSEVIARITAKVKRTVREKVKNGTHKPPVMGIEARQRVSERQSINNSGGRSKWFEYNGVKLQGTWELNLAKKFDELNIKWCKLKLRKDIIKYSLNNKTRSYTPDFYLEDYKLFVEVKGYWWGDDKLKMDAVIEQYPNYKFLIIENDQYKALMSNDLSCLRILS